MHRTQHVHYTQRPSVHTEHTGTRTFPTITFVPRSQCLSVSPRRIMHGTTHIRNMKTRLVFIRNMKTRRRKLLAVQNRKKCTSLEFPALYSNKTGVIDMPTQTFVAFSSSSFFQVVNSLARNRQVVSWKTASCCIVCFHCSSCELICTGTRGICVPLRNSE